MAASYAIGIDLGTTYSCAAVLRHSNQKPEIIPNEIGRNTTPSFVAYDEEGDVYAGSTAKDLAVENPESTVFDVKRLIGRSFYDPHIQKYMKLWPFQLVNIDGLVGVKVGDRSILPQIVAQELLSHLRNISQTFLHCPVESAVVTIPAYFSDIQKGLTREACYKAGLKKVEFITEPQAAAYAYGLQTSLPQGKSKLCLIFDLGGGTFDVTVFKISSDYKVEIKATGGDARLGGEDFNDLLTEYCIQDFQNQHGIDLTAGKESNDANLRLKTAKALRKLRNDCEKKKIHLSTTKKVVVSVDALYNGIDFTLAITRTIFENLIASHVNKCLSIIDKVLQKSGLRKNEIEDVVLIGGSSRIPKVEQVVSEYFGGIRLHRDISADEAVASGAAVHAYNIFQTNASLASVTVVNMNEHMAVYSSNNDTFSKPQPSPSTSAEAVIPPTQNMDMENHIKTLDWVRDLIMKHKAYFLPKTDELTAWFEHLQKLKNYFRHNPNAPEDAFELRLSNLLDTALLQDLAFILFERREDKDAGELYQKIHNRLKATVGENHLSAIKVEVLIARCFYRYHYEFEETLTDYNQLFENAYKRMSNVLGENHPEVLQLKYFIACSLLYNEKDSEALELAEKVYNAQASALGSECIPALRTQCLISSCYYCVNRVHEAITLATVLFKKKHQFLDSMDSENSIIKLRFGWLMYNVHKYKEALSLAADVFETNRKSLVPGHVVLLRAQKCMGLNYICLKKYHEGLTVLGLVFEGRKNILGLDHHYTLDSQHDVAWATDLSGRESEALKLYRAVYEKQLQILGPNHSDTIQTKGNIDILVNAGVK